MNYETDVLILGGGMACGRLLSALRKNAFQGRVAVVSAEAEVGYNRVLLPGLLAGDCCIEDLSAAQEWFDWDQLKLFTETHATSINLDANTVLVDSSDEIRSRFSTSDLTMMSNASPVRKVSSLPIGVCPIELSPMN